MEADKANILVNFQTSCENFSSINLHGVNHDDIIRAIYHQFGFGDTNNDFFNIYSTGNDNSTNGDANYITIIVSIYKWEKFSF